MSDILKEFIDYLGFQQRKGQHEMADLIGRAIAERRPAFIEGGTGNGKTFAYLIETIEYLHKHPDAKVTFSSSNILLQDQILKKDLPAVIGFMQEKYGDDFKISMADVVKLVGANNYLCEDDMVFNDDTKSNKSKILKEALGEDNFNKISEMAKQARRTKAPVYRRDLGNIKVPHDIWQEVACGGAGGCRCHEKGSSKVCAYKATTGSAGDARIIVTNHSYLANGSYIALAGRQFVVVDEAHKLPETFSKKANKEISLTNFQNVLRSVLEKTESGSILPELDSALKDVRDIATGLLERSNEIVETLLAEFSRSNKLAIKMNVLGNIGIATPEQMVSYLLGGEFDGEKQPNNAKYALRIHRKIDVLRDEINRVYSNEGNEQTQKKHGHGSMMSLLSALSSVKRYVDEIVALPQFNLHSMYKKQKKSAAQIGAKQEDDNSKNGQFMKNIVWFEKGMRNISILRAPVNHRYVQAVEARNIFKNITPVFVSATLSTSDISSDFSHFKRELGMGYDTSNHLDLKVPSVFQWEHQTKLIIPSDIPQPSYNKDIPGVVSEDTKKYLDSVAQSILESAKVVDGNSLVLCSSIFVVDYISKYIERHTDNNELVVLNQANGASIERMVHAMRQGIEPKKVFVGMQGVWQGLDLPGEALRGLFVVKIPFPTPNHPLAEERKELWKQVYRKNFFSDYVLPETKTLMRQGIGRLIRGEDQNVEYGVVVCYDPKFCVAEGSKEPAYMKEIRAVFPQGMMKTLERPTMDMVSSCVDAFFDERRVKKPEDSVESSIEQMATLSVA